ncbi:hypothetical protein SUGI_1123070 [Cryptomeria japonica]|nr:hypothetical protein SUGI_1123070 [Cryptomeria japonica]
MFSAGFDTSSVTLKWALSLLFQHSHVMRKAQEKLDSKVGGNRMVESDIWYTAVNILARNSERDCAPSSTYKNLF